MKYDALDAFVIATGNFVLRIVPPILRKLV